MVDEVPEAPAAEATTEDRTSEWKPGFNEYLLGGVIVLVLFVIGMGAALYLLPGDHLELSELQPVARVARVTEFPPGASRIVNWGAHVVLAVHVEGREYYAVQGTAPTDGCILEWDAVSQRIVSPCSYLVYDLHGNVVRGLTTVPLHRYAVFEREGIVYVTERLR
jgi:nitrite reductase/ring-hydroxylating ferredoxin subunit